MAAHRLAVLALPNVVPFDLGIACNLFAHAEDSHGRSLYDVSVCGGSASIEAGLFSISIPWGLTRLSWAQTIVIPGLSTPELPVSEEILSALRAAAARGARIASICSGAFVLAAAGLANGTKVTTHWNATAALADAYPQVRIDADVLYVDSGQIITSAGASAGIDMCLYMIGLDHGHAAAAHSARMAVAPLHRDGGQAQFSQYTPPASHTNLAPLLDWIEQNLAEAISMDQMAERARMSTRTFHRRFKEQTGTTPLQWLIRARVRHVQSLLETTDLPVDDISFRCGFESTELLREHFRRIVGVSPKEYRRSFKPARSLLANRPAAA